MKITKKSISTAGQYLSVSDDEEIVTMIANIIDNNTSTWSWVTGSNPGNPANGYKMSLGIDDRMIGKKVSGFKIETNNDTTKIILKRYINSYNKFIKNNSSKFSFCWTSSINLFIYNQFWLQL